MPFTSLTFLLFATVIVLLHYAASHWPRVQLGLLLVASYVWYASIDGPSLPLLLGLTAFGYSWAQCIEAADTTLTKNRRLTTGIAVYLCLLAVFKYRGFIASMLPDTWSTPSTAVFSLFDWVKAIGLSFITFQQIAYLVEVARGNISAERSLLRFACYVAMFPQILAGPIVRPANLLPQLSKPRKYVDDNLFYGLACILWGYFLKVGVADSLATVVNERFSRPEVHSSASLAVGVFFYAFQIYGDFAGYSEIAIGLARVLGYDLGKNFDRPYFSATFSEFWTRWHISLSSWLRDYLYIPLGGNRHGTLVTYRNLFVVMLLGGLWHGASWNFVIWGGLHGLLLVAQRIISKPWEKLSLVIPRPLLVLLSMLVVFVCTCATWIFFRAPDLSTSLTIFHGLAAGSLSPASVPGKFQVGKGLLLIAFVVGCEAVSFRVPVLEILYRRPWLAVLCGAMLLWLLAIVGTFGAGSFVYAQF